MKCKMCNTAKSRCPAFDGDFEKCWLGFPIKVKKNERFKQMDFRYYTPVCQCTKPKSLKEFVDMSLHQSRTRGVAMEIPCPDNVVPSILSFYSEA